MPPPPFLLSPHATGTFTISCIVVCISMCAVLAHSLSRSRSYYSHSLAIDAKFHRKYVLCVRANTNAMARQAQL